MLAAGWLLGWVSAASAQVAPSMWPRCIAERDGQQIGQGGSVCECHYERGGSITGKRPGWRWACDIMRMDGSQLELPIETPGGGRSLPPGFVYAPQQGGGAAQPQPDDPSGNDLYQRPLDGYEARPRGPQSLFPGPRRY